MLSEVRDLRQKRSVVATLPSGDTCGQPRLQHAFLFPVSSFKMIVMARWGGGGGVECPGYVVWRWGKQVFRRKC